MLVTFLALEDAGVLVRVVGRTRALPDTQAPLLAVLLRVLLSFLIEHALVPRLDRHHVKYLLLLAPVNVGKVAFRTIRGWGDQQRTVTDAGARRSHVSALSAKVILLELVHIVCGDIAIVE